MSKRTKKYISLVALSVLTNTCLFGFTSCSDRNLVKNTYEINESFSNIFVDTTTSNLTILPSTDGKCRVECNEKKNMKHSAYVSGDTLTIKQVDSRLFFQRLFNTGKATVKVYLPADLYNSIVIKNTTGDVDLRSGFNFSSINIDLTTGDVSCSSSASGDVYIKASTGDIKVDNIHAGSLSVAATTGDIIISSINSEGNVNLSVTTGKITVNTVSCNNLSLDGSTGKTNIQRVSCHNFTLETTTGDSSLTSVIASGKMSIDVSTGDVVFDACDAAEVNVKSTTGDVRGSFLTDKIIFANTSTGKINIPQSTVGGKCTIKTTTGNIKISIVGK